MFWSEIGSGFGELGGTLPPRIPRSTPLLGREYSHGCLVDLENSSSFLNKGVTVLSWQ